MRTIQKRAAGGTLGRDELQQVITAAANELGLNGERVLVIIPDGTRTMPMPLMFEILQQEIASKAAACDYLVALGTHQPMSEEQLSRLLGKPVKNGKCESAAISNHRWERPETFVEIGVISSDQVRAISQGLISETIHVRINRLLFEYDQVLICGPVFPHEVIGFSGGNKYLFPGVSTGEMIDHTHWLGALLGSYNIIGTLDTPVRALVDLAAEKVTVPVACFALVLREKDVEGIYFGAAREAWRLAAEHAAQTHVEWIERPFQRVLSVLPTMYDDLWTGAKGMYKAEPAIADGGEVIIYAPHISETSYTHKKYIDQIGYHCCEYFLKQWDRFAGIPRGVIAHSTHLRGKGVYNAATRIEKPRIKVTLATGISKERCRNLALDYMDPASIQFEDWRGREGEGIKLIPRAGETLYRVAPASPTVSKSERSVDEPAVTSQ